MRRVPLAILVTLHVASLFAEFLSPHSPVEQHRDFAWAPPTRVRWIDADGHLHLRPFVYAITPDPAQYGRYREDTTKRHPLRLLVRGEPYRLLGLWPTDLHMLGVDSPGNLFLLGTDDLGRDVFARTLSGARVSLFAGLLAAACSLSLGVLVGTVAGYLGGKTDALAMRVVELFMALPWLYFLLGLRAFLPLSVPPATTFFLIVSIIGLIGWARQARLVRGAVLSARERDFVLAAKGTGKTHSALLFTHVLPQTYTIITTQTAILVPRFILAEVTLSFLGLGLPQNIPSWGNLLSKLLQVSGLTSHWWLLAPALLLTITFLAYQQISATLSDVKTTTVT